MSHTTALFSQLLDHRRIDGDVENNLVVDSWAEALGEVFEPLGLIAFGDEEAGIEGSRVLRDPAQAPLWALAHAAMYVGATVPGRAVGESDEDYLARARGAVAYPLGLRRGSHEAVKRAIQPYLTGNRAVYILDNYGDPYGIYVRTLTGETPDPALIERLLDGDFVSGGQPGAIRAELALTYVTADAPAWVESTLSWDAASAVAWDNVTLEDVT